MKLRWPWTQRRMGHDMTCQQAVSLVTEYLDGALGVGDHDRLERHLDECLHCREHLKQIRATILLAGQVRADDLDPEALSDLMDLYRRWRSDGEAG